jgi:NTE family protein
MNLSLSSNKIKALRALLKANSYAEWVDAAKRYDTASEANLWKRQEQTRMYDYQAIRRRLDQLRSHLIERDDQQLLFALTQGIHGNLGRIGNPELYRKARFGTKHLIEQYIKEVADCIQHLAQPSVKEISPAQKMDFFQRASLCYGHSALLLSGGGVFGNFHAGVVKALIQQNMLPNVISGASAGSLITAVIGSHCRAELPALLTGEYLQIETEIQDRKPRSRFSVFAHEDVRRHIDRLVPDITFQEAYERSGLSINISISPSELHQTSRLMNRITSPDVCLRSAVLASCSVPGIFPAAQLMAKDHNGKQQEYLPGRRWVDGSVSDDIPARRLSRLYAVNHFIVSQVNPFALINRPAEERTGVSSDVRQLAFHGTKQWTRFIHKLSERYGRKWPEVRYNVNSLLSVMQQEYAGDINILPPPGLVQPLEGMRRQSPEKLDKIIHAGEKSTWPKIEQIRNATLIGQVLDQVLANEVLFKADITGTPKRNLITPIHTTAKSA